MWNVDENTIIYLLKCPLQIDESNQLTFNNANDQYRYFSNLPKTEITGATYQRKDNIIRFPDIIDNLWDYNYCMYKNDNGKWFYAFISDITYANNNTTMLSVKTDVWQTWCFDIKYKSCFVEREHVSDDQVGRHTVPEGLEYGDYISNQQIKWDFPKNSRNDFAYYVFQLTEFPEKISMPSYINSRIYNNVPQGCYYIYFHDIRGIDAVVESYDREGKANAIVALFTIPTGLFTDERQPFNWNGVDAYVPVNSFEPYIINNALSMNINRLYGYGNSIGGNYTPKNNKLLCYPYNYLHLANNSGSDATYKIEDFANPYNPKFSIASVITQGVESLMYPESYKDMDTIPQAGYNYGLTNGKYPILSWVSDYYLNWKAQNSTHLATSTTLGVISSVASNYQSGNAVGIVTDTGSQIENALHQKYIAEVTPNQAKGNVSVGELTYSLSKSGYTLTNYRIKGEYAKQIDDYLSMYGYKVNSVKIPNVRGRRNWNYVRTKGCNFSGNFPQQDLMELHKMFDTGITFWHNPSTFLDYTATNNII